MERKNSGRKSIDEKDENAAAAAVPVLVLMMLISVLPVSAMAAELTPSDPETGLTATDVTNELTDSDRLAIFEDNMDSDKVSKSEIPADDEMVRVIVQLDADSLLDVRNRTNASMSMLDFQQTDAAKAQLKDIANLQLSVMNTMESKGIPSSFTFSYTSVVSGFAAQVPYGKIHEIKSIDGVEDVVLCQTYYTDSMGSATLGQALTAAEVAAYSNNTQYQGEGMLIGILDTGLDVNHEAFANAPAVQKLQKSSLSKLLYQISQGEDGKTNITAYSYAALWYAQKHSSSSLVLLTEDDLYKSGKVPFAFDYADADADVIPSADAVEKYGNDHGTHVAGITAGKTVDADGSVTFAGQSPEAQLAIFKVFSDSTNGASTDTILAALNDALLLDVDVINMSLGSNGGFGREAEGDLTTKYYDLVKSAGILLNCSAGNSYSSSQGGAKGDFTSVSDPDTGIISSSSSYDAALSVASVNANETAAFVTAQGRVPYQDVSGHDFTALLLGNDSSKTYEYVMVPNTGDTADYQGLDVTGKIAVVMRGGLSFEQKQLNAASAGAAGCIIYNNRDGYLLNMAVDNYKIPTVCISLANGQMMEAAQEKTLTVSKTEKGSVAMSDFSSWGPLPSLSLKPEITAPGGSIYSSLPFAQYGYMSGTSMASPYLAGVSAAALQYVNTLMPSASDTDKQLLVNRLLMSTADILYDENGVAYSPRKQGSGMVNLAEAVTTPAYLYVRGQDKTKIELGDDADQLGVYKLSFVVKNLTGSALAYDVNTTVQTESTTSDGLYIAQKGYVLSADTSAIKVSGGALSGSTVTVPANGEATVTVTVRLSDADRAYLAKFPNGIYVEGFVELTNNDDPALSVPFLGFYGDWTKAPIFEDADIYNGLDTKMYATNVAGVYAMMYVVKLGMYPFVVPEGYDTPSTSADKICVDLGGGNGVSNLYYLQAGLLRAAKTTNVTITDSDTGEVYLNSDGLNVRKAMYNSSSAAVRPGYVGEIFPPLTGIHLIPNNTRMTYTAAAYVDGFDVQDNLKNTYSFNFTSDGEMPYIVDRENLQFRTGDDGRKYLDVTLADNFCLAGATLYSTQWKTNVNNGKKEMSIGSNYYDGIIPALKADGTSPRAYEEYTYTFDVTDFYQKLLQGTFYVVAYDYAMNQCAYRVTLPENAVTKITLDQTAVTLPQKGYVQLNATVTPDDATDQNLVWSSSDSSVAEVKNGIVAAKAPGTATITVKSSVWTDVEAQCQVTVTDEVGADVPMSEFLLNTSSVTMLAGTTYTNVRLYGYAPFYATDLNLEWTSSDESVVTVEPNGEGDQLTQYAKLTALKPGTATVTAKAKNGTASYDLAVTVTEATGSGSFNIVGDTLVSYSGTESTVTIPDGVRVIGENAFKNNDYVLNVICPDSLEEIGYRAFYDCDNLQSVSLPETMKVINEGAFYYCKNLKTLGHTDDGVLPKGLTSIGVKAFYFCEALEGDLVIPEGVTSLSAGIFYNAYTLTSITIPDTVTSMDANGDQFANCTAVTSVTLSKNLTELPKTAFFTLKSLKHLPDLSNVTSVGTSCFAGCAALEEMVIPESLTFIGANAFARSSLTEITVLGDPTGLDSAFYNSLNLTTFVAPKLTTIGKQMFQGCTALVNFIVPDNVTLIGERAFQGCTNLKTLTFPASYKAETLSFGLTPFVSCPAFEGYVIEDGASIVRTEDGTLLAGGGKVLVSLPRDFKGTSYTVPDGVETISDYLFYKNTTITSVTLPASLKKIGTAAFQGCTKLTSIALPDGFTTLGEHAFDGCSGLKTVTFGQSLTAVPAYAFSNCSALTAVDLPATVETVGDYAFRGCAKATALSLKEGLTSIGANAFYGWKALKAITIPQSVTSLGGSAFYDCNAAASIDCGSLTVIPDRAFYNAKAVKTVKLSDNVTSIGERAFYSCSLLETINWPSQLKTIGRQAFYYARKLQNLDFSGTQLESIGNSAFYQPYEARTLAFPDTLQSIDSKAFAYLNYNKTAYVTEVNIPASVTSLAKDAFYLASGLKNIVVDANNPVYASSNGVVMLKDTGDIYIWPQGNETTEFTLPATMTEIPDKMFQNNTSLKKVIVPASVTKVGSYGYQNMSGTSMASPQVAGMAAVVAQYIRANKLTEKTGLTARALAQSLLMSTAVPMYQDYGEGKYGYYSVMQQGAGLANVGAAVSAGTYIKMDKNANAGAADGKVKVELGDDPARTGEYSFGFTIYNLKDAATSFNLSADFFTQDVFANQFEDGSVVNFEDTYTALLSSNVTWTVDGQMVEMTAPEGLANCDFNGDGKVTKADGQALLDYVTGVLDSISNKDNADFDNDGSIDTYDAYLFFQQLNKSTVEIPANGSIHVEVNAKVLGLDEYDKASDNAGTYVEGYVYADEVASAEGVKGDSHSIPVLGYYGSWTDPSMFDIGSYLEYHEAKTESRVPYMYAYNKNATKYQALTVQYAGDSGMYYFGGNPYVDETYDPNRAAINPDTTVFARATFSLIRNAADSRATITGENGTVYYDKASGSPTAGAYYYSNGGSWRNAQGYIGINNAPTKAAEGEKITVKVTEAPEYYVTYDAEGNATTNWDALGDGASRTYTAFIDRTEPVLSNVYFKEDVETGTRSLVLTAQDNRYVAAAFLIDYDKMSILDRTAGSPEGAAEGAATDISLDLSKAEGVDHLLVQVADYADNTATYKINLNKEELSGPVSVTLDKQSIKMYKGGTAALNAEVSPFGVKPDGVTWKSSDETVATVNERGIITGVNKGTATITAASIKDPTATAECVVTVQTVDTTLVGALMDTNGDAQFYTWDMEHDTTWKKLVNFETTKSVSASTFDARTGNVYLQDGSFNINKMDLDTGKTLATYPGFEGEIPMWDMEYSLVYSTEAKPMLASVYATYFLSPKPVDNLDLSAFDLGLYLWLFADASYFTAVTSLGANKIDTDDDGVKDTDTELFLALDDAGNIWTMNVYPTKDEKTGKDTWGASFGIIESNLANVGYAANPTDDGDLYDSLYATVEGQELVLYLANFTGDASHVYRILLNEDTGKWEAADIGNFGDGVWPATLVGTMYHANEDAAKAVNAAMSKTTVHTAQAVEMTPAQIQRYNGAETQAAKGSLNTAAPVAAVVNLPMGDAAENATASNVTVSADEKTVTVNVLAKDAATNGLFTVDYDAANLTLTNVAFNTQYSSYKDASGKVTLGYVDLNGVTAGSTVATLTFTVKDPTALDKINVTVTETERNDQTVNNAETLTADLHTETETVNAKAATCTEDGYTGDVVCKACGKVITKGEVIPALGHKIELVGAKAATCTEDGYTGDEVCTICGEIVKKGEVIPALGHKIKLVGAKEPTCTEDGYTGDEVCTICGEIVKKGEVIKATGHQYKDGKCTVCGAADPNYKPSVKTGDESNTALWVLVMASAALLAAAVVVLPRKKHSR